MSWCPVVVLVSCGCPDVLYVLAVSTAPKEKPPADGKMSKSKKKRLKKKLKRQQELLDIQLKQMNEVDKTMVHDVSPLMSLHSRNEN